MLRFFCYHLLAAAGLLALGGCDRADVNGRHQAGAWHIARVNAQTFGPNASQKDVADPGDVSFTRYDGSTKGDNATFYFDKAITTRLPLGVGTKQGNYIRHYLNYTPDRYDRHRIILSRENTNRADDVVIYSLTEDGADHQYWQLTEINTKDEVTYREEWELRR
jgi:hypothetical protein